MKPEEILTIPIDSIESDFDNFLSPESNKRIIFSGSFGIGKTYFLNKFFQSRNQKYLPIFLRPVNYSLLSNEDVFKLIKYDILLQLINKRGFEIESEFDFSNLDYANFFIGHNKFLILQNLLKLIPKIHGTIDGIEDFRKLIEAFRKGKEEINKDSELKMLFDFQHETQDNFLIEYDHVSQFIANKLDEIAFADMPESSLKKVLIIDDLDRLDPEHIFRLFNVFSAHFDHVNYYPNDVESKDNKFGFDKIIFVCDIENIRILFANKYGVGFDFSGYIDKFNSLQIYHMFHKNAFQNYIQTYIDIQFKKFSIIDNGQFKKILYYTLQVLFDGRQLNLRDIFKIAHINLSDLITNENKLKNVEVQLDKIGAHVHSYIKYYPLCISVIVLSKLFGNSTIFSEKLDKAFIISSSISIDQEYESYEFSRIIPQLILFADYKNHKFLINDANSKNSAIYTFENNSKLTYTLYESSNNSYYTNEGPLNFGVNLTEKNIKVNKAMFNKTLVSASKIIADAGIINI